MNNQQSNCNTEKQDGIDAITLLKPLLIEVLDEIKDTKLNNNAERINTKMQSMQHDINEKIELMKPTLLEVLNELKENKKFFKQEVPTPRAPVEMIRPMLVGVLEEIKESNRKTQQALNEMKNDKKETLRVRKQSMEYTMNEPYISPRGATKMNAISDQTEYESTKEENVNSVDSDESYMNHKETQEPCKGTMKIYNDKLRKEVVKIKPRIKENNCGGDKVEKKNSNRRKRKSHKHGHKHKLRNIEKSSENISPSIIFNASEILSSPIKKEIVKDVIKVMTKQKLVSLVSELLADRFIDKLKEERDRNETRRVNSPISNLVKIEETKDLFNAKEGDTTTDKPVTIQRFEIFLG